MKWYYSERYQWQGFKTCKNNLGFKDVSSILNISKTDELWNLMHLIETYNSELSLVVEVERT